MPRCNKERKSRSVNDIPIQKKQSELLLSLDEDDFSNLLESVSQPSYSRKKPNALLPFTEESTDISSKELSSIGKVCEKNLRDEDEAHQKREEMDNSHRFRSLQVHGEYRTRNPSSSPPSSTSSSNQPVKKPVGHDAMLQFIDDGIHGASNNGTSGDVEMQEIVGSSKKYKLGNEESTPHEYLEDRSANRDIEAQNNVRDVKQRYLNSSVNAHKWPIRPEESGKLVRDETHFTRDEHILAPHRPRNFCSFPDSIPGTDEIPNTTPYMPGRRLAPKKLPPFPKICGIDYQQRLDEKKQRLADVHPISKKIDAKRRKKKKDDGNTFTSNEITGYMGELPVDQLLVLIEGPDKKSVSSSVDLADVPEVKEKQRKKSKEVSAVSVVESATVPTAAIGNQQGKASETPAKEAEISKTGLPLDSSKKNSPRRKKGRGTEPSLAVVNSKKSAEEGEDEFLSADESLVPNQKKNTEPPAVSSLVLDGNNYRADSDDLTRLESMPHDEEEFITVGNKSKKKNHPVASQQTSRTGSTGKMERHSRDSEKADNVRRNSLEERSIRSYKRPNMSSLGDYMDEKKCAADNTKLSSVAKNSSKKAESFPDLDASALGNRENNVEGMAACLTPKHAATKSTSERSFSYADAAKKSSDSSRETSPLNGQSLLTNNIALKSDENGPVGAVVAPNSAEIPAVDPSSSTGGLSFFYEDDRDSQDPKSNHACKDEDGSLILNLGGKTVRFGKGPSTSTLPIPEETRFLIEVMQQRWEKFLEGTEPIRFKPRS